MSKIETEKVELNREEMNTVFTALAFMLEEVKKIGKKGKQMKLDRTEKGAVSDASKIEALQSKFLTEDSRLGDEEEDEEDL
jgi:hypothetical protein